MNLNPKLAKVSYAVAGLIVGGTLAGALGAQAATTAPTPSATTLSSVDAHPGDNGADGVPEAQEVHGGHGAKLNLSGTTTAVTASSVTIKTSTATTVYSVTSASDIDKNGEAIVSSLVVGDKVTFSVVSSNAKQIDKLHAGDETKNTPTAGASSAG